MYNFLIEDSVLNSNMLFHYTKSTTGLEKIICNKFLKFNNMENTNDPKESRERDIKISYDTSKTNEVNTNISYYKKLLNDIRLKETKLLCFTTNKKNIDKKFKKNCNESLLYQTGFFKPRMWAQYGENHRGICLGFDKDELVKAMSSIKYDKFYRSLVSYSNSMKNIYSSTHFEYEFDSQESFRKYYLDKHLKVYRDVLYFSKSYDWRDEAEYRFLIIQSDSNTNELLDISKALRAVFLGVDFPNVYIESLKKVVSEDIKIYQLTLIDGRPNINKL